MFQSVEHSEIPSGHPIDVFGKYWCARLGDDGVFAKSSFRVADCGAVLPWVILIEEDPEGYLYKVVGEEVSFMFKHNMTGHHVGEGIEPEAAARFFNEFEKCRDEKTPSFSRVSLPIKGREFIEVFRAVFPAYCPDRKVWSYFVVVARPAVQCARQSTMAKNMVSIP